MVGGGEACVGPLVMSRSNPWLARYSVDLSPAAVWLSLVSPGQGRRLGASCRAIEDLGRGRLPCGGAQRHATPPHPTRRSLSPSRLLLPVRICQRLTNTGLPPSQQPSPRPQRTGNRTMTALVQPAVPHQFEQPTATLLPADKVSQPSSLRSLPSYSAPPPSVHTRTSRCIRETATRPVPAYHQEVHSTHSTVSRPLIEVCH